jgi:hypothetical protein
MQEKEAEEKPIAGEVERTTSGYNLRPPKLASTQPEPDEQSQHEQRSGSRKQKQRKHAKPHGQAPSKGSKRTKIEVEKHAEHVDMNLTQEDIEKIAGRVAERMLSQRQEEGTLVRSGSRGLATQASTASGQHPPLVVNHYYYQSDALNM